MTLTSGGDQSRQVCCAGTIASEELTHTHTHTQRKRNGIALYSINERYMLTLFTNIVMLLGLHMALNPSSKEGL